MPIVAPASALKVEACLERRAASRRTDRERVGGHRNLVRTHEFWNRRRSSRQPAHSCGRTSRLEHGRRASRRGQPAAVNRRPRHGRSRRLETGRSAPDLGVRGVHREPAPAGVRDQLPQNSSGTNWWISPTSVAAEGEPVLLRGTEIAAASEFSVLGRRVRLPRFATNLRPERGGGGAHGRLDVPQLPGQRLRVEARTRVRPPRRPAARLVSHLSSLSTSSVVPSRAQACFRCATPKHWASRRAPPCPPRIGGGGSSDVRPGDWTCAVCGANVFASKVQTKIGARRRRRTRRRPQSARASGGMPCSPRG